MIITINALSGEEYEVLPRCEHPRRFLGTLLFVIVLGMIGTFSGIYFMMAVNDRLATVIDRDSEKINLAGRVSISFLETHRAEKNLLISFTEEQVNTYAARSLQYRARLMDELLKLEALATQEERESIQRFRTYFAEFQSIHRRIESLVRAGGKDRASVTTGSTPTLNMEAVDLSVSAARSAYDEASREIADIIRKLEASLDKSKEEGKGYVLTALWIMLGLLGVSTAGGLVAGILMTRPMTRNIAAIVDITDSISRGKLDTPIRVESGDETGKLAASVKRMQSALLEARNESQARDWLKTGIARVNDAMRGRTDALDLCSHVISEMAAYLGAQVGAIFLADGGPKAPLLKFVGGYAYSNLNSYPDKFGLGEGLVGQAAAEKKQIVLRDVPENYIRVCSGLGDSCPTCITLTPLTFEERVNGVIELGFLKEPTSLQLDYLGQVMSDIAITIETVRGREELAKALSQAQMLTEELRSSNEELEEQTQRVMQSQEKLESANQELEEKNDYLNRQKEAIERANRDLERARLDVEEKAEQLEIASRYKSEFLANMSHELRTPLNSMLLLSGMLSENKEKNLDEEQVRSARIIYNCGNDLLSLINDILDLSKIEAGRIDVHFEEVQVRSVGEELIENFRHLADEKNLSLVLSVNENCPGRIRTDQKRFEQILKNLMSNAIKFTEKGSITVSMGRSDHIGAAGGLEWQPGFAVTVQDTGIGIPADKHRIIFDAFQQLDGGASRKYGGTGLGLSISRELARLLGGEIRVASDPGKGSAFTLYLPVERKEVAQSFAHSGSPVNRNSERNPRSFLPGFASEPNRIEIPREAEDTPQLAAVSFNLLSAGSQKEPSVSIQEREGIKDDRDLLQEEDQGILIIEDDRRFAGLLIEQCRKRGLKCLFASSGEEGVRLAREHVPKGIILDIRLPGRDGWSILDELKETPRTRHIPVHIMSVEDAASEALRRGAVGFLTKPVNKDEMEQAISRLEHTFSRAVKDVLIVEDDEHLRTAMVKLIAGSDVHIEEAARAEDAIEAIRTGRYDCVILDLGLPDMNGLEMLRRIEAEKEIHVPPVIVYTGRELTHEEEAELRHYSVSIIVKGARSEERLLDEACLFLHRMISKMPEKKRQIITNLHDADTMFQNRQALIVDDDMRNAFALSRLLESKGMKTLKAENGNKALELLESRSDIDLVLMDIMMPGMDGYETMKRIRSRERFSKLPIIALTAKAMRQDRERCLAAGASDYLAKPVDVDRLLSMMRVWLYR